jgi:hypothetical protein
MKMSLVVQGKKKNFERLFSSLKPKESDCPSRREGGAIEKWEPRGKELE